MTLRHLKIFKVVCEQGSITKAAHTLYMSQPAVTHAIQELEKELKVQLFDRLSKKLYLNEAGKIILEKTKTILIQYDDLKANAQMITSSIPIRIGSSITIANFLLPDFLNEFAKVCPQAIVKVCIENAQSIEEKLKHQELDIALIEGTIHNNTFYTKLCSSFELAFLCSPLHPFAKKSHISLQEFIKEPLLLREKGSAIRDSFDSALLLNNHFIEPAWESVNSQALIQGVKHNLGVSILPRILVKEELKNNVLNELYIHEISLSNPIYLVYHKDSIFQSSTLQLLSIIEKLTMNSY